MKHHEIAGAMPGLKYDVGTAVDEADAMIDKLAATPAGHPAASELSQKIKSSLGRVRSAIDNVQPDDDQGGDFGGPQPNGGQVVGDGGNPDNLANIKAAAPGPDNDRFTQLEDRTSKLEDGMSKLGEKIDTLHADLGGAPEAEHHHHVEDHEEEHHDEEGHHPGRSVSE